MKNSEELHHHDVTGNTIFGFWIYLMTDFILFATLFATYAVVRQGVAGGPGPRELFDARFALYETLILLTSSLTCGFALSAARRGSRKEAAGFFGATFLLGLLFLGLVGGEMASLIQAGTTWQKSAFLSSYFTLVGTHALHILFGLLFIVLFVIEFLRWGSTDTVLRRLTCLSLFWFFSYIVWIFMFTIVYLMGVA